MVFARTRGAENLRIYRRFLCVCGHAQRSHEHTGPYDEVCKTCRKHSDLYAYAEHVFRSKADAYWEEFNSKEEKSDGCK